MKKAVCPPQLKGGLFTTAAVDNIDHNQSSTSVHDSFNGTGTSLFQHSDSDFTGVQRFQEKAAKLPDLHTKVFPLALLRQDSSIPEVEGPNKADC